jgi:hypothetical protein
MTMTGGCLCGALRYEGRGAPTWVGHCHCRWCQRQSGAAFLTYVGFTTQNLTWTRGRLATYASSPGVERGFCPNCGSSLTFARPDRGEISVFAGSLDEPDRLVPTAHAFYDSHQAWLQIDDDMPRHGRHPPGNEDRDLE